MDLKKVNAPVNTETYDRNKLDAPTQNIYEAISVISRRAEQINTDIRKELIDKLEEFATYNDSLEEVFENKEQIEVVRTSRMDYLSIRILSRYKQSQYFL